MLLCLLVIKRGGGELSLKQTYTLSAKTLLIIGIIFNLCLLGIFKYTDFFLENFNLFTKLLHLDFAIPLPHILLPLALSFVTFQQIAFLADCYKQSKDRVESTRDNVEIKLTSPTSNQDSSNAESKKLQENIHINFLDYCLFITFFPQLIAGPIVHHKEMMPQFYAMSKGDSACSDKAGSLSFACAIDTQVLSPRKSLRNPASSSTILESQTKNKPTKDSRIFTQEVQNVAKSQVEVKVDSNKSLSDSKILDEKCGLQAKAQGSYLDGNDRRASVQLPHLSSKAQSQTQKPTPSIINWGYIAKGLHACKRICLDSKNVCNVCCWRARPCLYGLALILV